MKIWKCKCCDYDTDRKNDYNKHINTNKHKKKLNKLNEQIIMCELCNCKFINVDEFNKHLNSQLHLSQYNTSNRQVAFFQNELLQQNNDINEKLLDEISIIKKQFEDYNIKYAKLEEANSTLMEALKNSLETNKTTAEAVKTSSEAAVTSAEAAATATKTANKSMNALTFLRQNYKDAPPIPLLKQDVFTKVANETYRNEPNNENSKKSLEEIIILHHAGKTLIGFLGDTIVDIYTNKNSKKQSIWNSDVSRLTFLIKNVLNENAKSEWIQDKKGIYTKKFIIQPMLNVISNSLTKYIDETNEYVDQKTLQIRISKKEECQIQDLLSKTQIASELNNLIISKKIHNDILKYIAPYFNLIIDKPDKQKKSATD